MDAFYASCEGVRHPEFAGRPLVVGADPRAGHGRGVVVACNYAARALGVRTAQPIRTAYELAPQAAYVWPDHAYYSRIGRAIFDDLRTAYAIDRVSIDEAFVDATGHADFARAKEWATSLQRRVEGVSGGLTCSVGIGPNRLVAKVASAIHKPNGTTVVPPDEVQAFLAPLPVDAIPYIGPKTTQRLDGLGIRTVRELRSWPEDELVKAFGAHGAYMFQASRGQDDSPFSGHDRREHTIGHEETLDEDTRDRARLIAALRRMMRDIEEDLDREGLAYKTVALKIRYSDFATFTRQVSLPQPAKDTTMARRVVPRLLDSVLRDPRRVRLIGLRVATADWKRGQRTLGQYAS